MQHPQLVDYITQRLQRGDAELDIRRELERAGWEQGAVDQAWRAAASGPVVSMHEPHTAKKKSHRAPRHKRKKMSRVKRFMIGLGLFVAMVALGAWLIHHLQAPNVAYSGDTGSTANNIRQDDAGLIAEAVSNYIGSNGSLPQSTGTDSSSNTVHICGKVCDSNTFESTQLYFYKPSAIKYHAYSSGLAPDTNTVYIVNGAACSSSGGIGARVTNGQDAVVVLYAFVADHGMHQKCLSLQGDNPVSP